MGKKITSVDMMTAREVVRHETPEEFKAAMMATAAAQRRAGNSFELTIAGIEAWAQKQVDDAPNAQADSLDASVVDHATKVLRLIRFVRMEIKANNAPEAARFALEVGEIFNQIQATISWIRHVEGYEGIRQVAAEKGRAGGQAKGRIETGDGKATNLTTIIANLPSAFAEDELGDFLESDVVWPELFAELDRLKLHPVERGRTYTYTGGKTEFSTFKSMLSQIRKQALS